MGNVFQNVALVADSNHSVSRAYDVVPPDAGVALRGTFFLDPPGIIQHATIDHAPVGRNAKKMLRLLETFECTAEHGEVCSAGWEKGR